MNSIIDWIRSLFKPKCRYFFVSGYLSYASGGGSNFSMVVKNGYFELGKFINGDRLGAAIMQQSEEGSGVAVSRVIILFFKELNESDYLYYLGKTNSK